MLHFENVVAETDLRRIRHLLDGAPWQSGEDSAGAWNRSLKKNLQLPEGVFDAERETLMRAIMGEQRIEQAIFPARGFAPKFNRYCVGDYYRLHNDNVLNVDIRADVSYTIFLCEPSEYEGGELMIYEAGHSASIKLPAGSVVMYPSGCPHEVLSIRAGQRTCAVGWLQSLVRTPEDREILSLLRTALEGLFEQVGPRSPGFRAIAQAEAMLQRRWFQT